MSHAMGQNSLTPLGNNNLTFNSHVIRLASLKPRQISRPVDQKAIEVGQRFSLEKEFIIQEKGFTISG